MSLSVHSSDNDDDEDVVVLRVCANCCGIEDLEFDEETNESYCLPCRKLFARTKYEGFRILLSNEDLALVSLIFAKFDSAKKGYWDYKDWLEFQKCTGRRLTDEITNNDELAIFFKEEYDLDLKAQSNNGTVIQLSDLENMYGGYAYNRVTALTEDSEALENEGIIDTGVLE